MIFDYVYITLSLLANWREPEGKRRKLLAEEFRSVVYKLSISLTHFSSLCRTKPMSLSMEPCMLGPFVCSLWLWLTALYVPLLYLLVSSMLFIYRISHTGIKLKLLQCGVFPQGSSTWCWSTLWTNTTCTLPICQLASNAMSTWEPWIKLWLHLLSAWYGSTFSLSSE